MGEDGRAEPLTTSHRLPTRGTDAQWKSRGRGPHRTCGQDAKGGEVRWVSAASDGRNRCPAAACPTA
nr:hypothetical protein StreXyl84_63160 [Streptomyces sp. Xyl84]